MSCCEARSAFPARRAIANAIGIGIPHSIRWSFKQRSFLPNLHWMRGLPNNLVAQPPSKTPFEFDTFLDASKEADVRADRSISQIGLKADMRRCGSKVAAIPHQFPAASPDLPQEHNTTKVLLSQKYLNSLTQRMSDNANKPALTPHPVFWLKKARSLTG